MGLLVSGLLGGIQAGARAVEQLSDDKLKALAEKLKMDALEAMDKRRELRGQKFQTSERIAREGFQAGESKLGRTFEAGEGLLGRKSAEKISEAGLLSQETRATAKLDLDKIIVAETKRYHDLTIKAKEGSTEAATRRAQVDAWKEVGKISERFGSIDEMNGVLAAAGISDYFVAGEGKDTKPKLVKGKAKAKTGPGFGGPAMGVSHEERKPRPDTGQSDLDALLAMGRRGAGGSKLEGEVIPQPKLKGLLEVPEVGGEDMLQGAQKEFEGTETKETDLGDPSTWTVTFVESEGKYYIETSTGKRLMTQKEIEKWKGTLAGQGIFGKPAYDPKFPYVGK